MDKPTIPQKPPFEETPEFILSSVKYQQDSHALVRELDRKMEAAIDEYHDKKTELIRKLNQHRDSMRQRYDRGEL